MIGYSDFGRRPDSVWVGGREIPFAEASREPCPVCGHPTGDCAESSSAPDHVAGYNEIDSLIPTQTFLLEEDVFEEKQITPFTVAKVLKYPAGKYIPLEEARNLGLA